AEGSSGEHAPKEVRRHDDDPPAEGDVITSTIDGILDIRFSERIHMLVRQGMSKVVTIKLLGRRIGFSTLNSKLYAIWKMSRMFQLMDLDNDYYIVKFQARADYEKALAEELELTCMAVSINLRLPLISKLRMEGKVHIVEYENMPNVYYDCGYFGHMNEGCPKIQLEKKKEMGDDRNVDQNKAQELKQLSLLKLDKKSELKAFGRSEVQDEPKELSLNHGLRRKFLMGGLSTLELLDETNMGLKWEEKNMVPIGETLVSGHKVDVVIKKLGFKYSHRIELMHVKVTAGGLVKLFFWIVVYGSPSVEVWSTCNTRSSQEAGHEGRAMQKLLKQ
ncbi:hypothetical protein Golax_010651, partial [Gossypium laxum]|nr:hypothetical protein [Gossypium laxum]